MVPPESLLHWPSVWPWGTFCFPSVINISTFVGRVWLESWMALCETDGSSGTWWPTFSPTVQDGGVAWGFGLGWEEPLFLKGIKDVCLGFVFVVTKLVTRSFCCPAGLRLASSLILLLILVAFTRPNVALTSWMVILAWWWLPGFKSILFVNKSSVSTQKSFLMLGLVLLLLASEDRESELVSPFVQRAWAALFVFGAFFLETLTGSLGSGSGGRVPETDLVLSSDPVVTWSGFAASIKARTLFFFGLEMSGGGAELREVTAILICSDSFGFFFFLVDVAAGDDDTVDIFELSASDDSPVAVGSEELISWEDDVWLVGGDVDLAAALQCGRWLFNLLKVFPQNGHTSVETSINLDLTSLYD